MEKEGLMKRRVIFRHTKNTRDLGGYPTQAGACTRYNSFIRSDAPIRLLDSEVDYLRINKITTIVDLRGDGEAYAKPCFLSGILDFKYYRRPLYGDGKIPDEEEDIPDSYLDMLKDEGVVYSIMKLFADADDGILFHCTAGKDRTGVIAALLLSLAEVPLADILADYQISYVYISDMIRAFHKANPSLASWVGQSKPEYLEIFLSRFYRKYRSTRDYLVHIGLNETEVERIITKLYSDI